MQPLNKACFENRGDVENSPPNRCHRGLARGRRRNLTSLGQRCGPIVALTLAFFLLLGGVGAGQNATLITLDQAIDLALAHNHSLRAQRTLILQNQAQEITANLRPNPTFVLIRSSSPSFSPTILLRQSERDPAVRRRNWISV